MKKTTSKRIAWTCVLNGIAWVWCSYFLAFLGREQIAEDLSKVAVTQIVATVLIYCLKSLFEKRKNFGEVGRNEVTLKEDNSEESVITDM